MIYSFRTKPHKEVPRRRAAKDEKMVKKSLAMKAMHEKRKMVVKAMKMMHFSRPVAEGFYAVHSERPFFGELVEFMCRGPVVVSVLEGEDAIKRYRDLMGATNPENAVEGTIRKRHGASASGD